MARQAPADDDAMLKSLGARARDARRDRGLTLARLAEATGLSSRFLADVEKGRANISVVNLARLARALGTTAHDLLESERRRCVALLGLRGAGKSAVGAALAKRLRAPLVELDSVVEEQAGLPLREIFAVHGETYYRRLEAEALEQVLARPAPSVVATGGGIVTSPATYERLRRTCFTVWLRARPEDHMRRVERQGDLRPMARRPNAMSELRQILTARAPLYAQAELVVDTADRDVDAVAGRIASEAAARAG